MWNLGLIYRVATIGSLQTIWWKSLELSSKIQEPIRLFFRRRDFLNAFHDRSAFCALFYLEKIRPNFKVNARNLALSPEMAIKHLKLQQRRLVQSFADPKSMQNSSLHYFFSYLADFNVVMRKLISE